MSTSPRLTRAEEIARVINKHHFNAHRGAVVLSRRRELVIFGNDGYRPAGGDDRAQREARLVLNELHRLGSEPAFGTDEDGYSWVAIVEGIDQLDWFRDENLAGWAEALVWWAWEKANNPARSEDEPFADPGFVHCQQTEAAGELDAIKLRLDHHASPIG